MEDRFQVKVTWTFNNGYNWLKPSPVPWVKEVQSPHCIAAVGCEGGVYSLSATRASHVLGPRTLSLSHFHNHLISIPVHFFKSLKGIQTHQTIGEHNRLSWRKDSTVQNAKVGLCFSATKTAFQGISKHHSSIVAFHWPYQVPTSLHPLGSCLSFSDSLFSSSLCTALAFNSICYHREHRLPHPTPVVSVSGHTHITPSLLFHSTLSKYFPDEDTSFPKDFCCAKIKKKRKASLSLHWFCPLFILRCTILIF